MGLFYPEAPSYKGAQPQQAQRSTTAAPGIWTGLVGGGRPPSYRRGGRSAQATQPTPSCWWMPFPGTPQYKTVMFGEPEPETCDPEPLPPDCDDDPEVYLADDGTPVW